MISEEIADRYEVISVLHNTAATAVLLVKTVPVGDIRILKAIPKSHPDSARILSEANLLSEFKSPKIPTIYDLGQTENWHYFVEEYVEGQPLQEYLLENQPVSKNTILCIIIEICKVISLLHISADEPVIYRDMKPEHVVIREDEIRIIDFGAAEKQSLITTDMSLCSKKFAAPEQLNCQKLDVRTDVYGIGKVLEYCLPYMTARDQRLLVKIVRDATASEQSKRISSVKELQRRLEALQGKKSNEIKKKRYLNRKIAVVGNTHGAGCTHISLNLCKYLNDCGVESVYYSLNGENTVQMLAGNLKSFNLKDGILYHAGFKGWMNYGPAVEPIIPPNENQILDCGRTKEKPIADVIVYVYGMRPWTDNDNNPEWITDNNVIIIANLGSTLASLDYSKEISKKVYIYSRFSKPFKITSKEKRLFDVIRKAMEC